MARSYWGAAGTEPNQFAGWSEARKRFFEQYGYDRGPTPPETTVKVTETPPDDPTPTTRVTTTKYPSGKEPIGQRLGEDVMTFQDYPFPLGGLLGGEEEAVDPRQALRDQGAFDRLGQGPGTVMGYGDPTWTPEETINLPPTITPEDRFGPQDTIAGAPETSRIDQNRMLLAQQGQQVWHIDEETGEEVTVQDIMDAQDENLALGPMAGSVRVSFNVLKAMDKVQRARYWNYIKNFVRGKGGKKVETKKPQQPPGRGDIPGWSAYTRQLDRARAQEKLLRNAETAAAIGTGVAGGVAVGLLGQPEEEGPYYEGYSPVLEEGRGASPAEAAATTATAIGEDYQGILDEKQEFMDKGLSMALPGLEEQKVLDATAAEVARVAAEDDAKKQAELDRYYANFPEDIEGKRERYLKALKEIYKKVAILNVIAALTNSPSQAGQFMQMAAEKFKTLEGFRGEERLQKIARGVFFKENGEFDAPASKQDAFHRAMRFGANHDEALALSGHKREETARTTPTGYQIWSNEATGQQTYLPKGEVPPGEGWLPKAAPAETKGTAFERITLRATELINGNNIEQAVSLLSYWLMGKDSMLRDFLGAEEADTIARSMVERLSKQLDADPVAIAAELGIDTGGQGVTTAQPSNPRRPR